MGLPALTKARGYAASVGGRSPGRSYGTVPRMFAPPPSGQGYSGSSYRWQQVLAYKDWVFVAVQAWMREIAGGSPPNLGTIRPKNPKNNYDRKAWKRAKRKALGGPRQHEEFEQWDSDHPHVRLFQNPNGPDVAYDLWAWHILFKKLTGVSYWWVVRNSFGVPVEIWVLPSHWVRLMTGPDGQPEYYWLQSPWGPSMRIPYDEVVCFYEHSPLNRYEGLGVTQAVAEWIDAYENSTRARNAQYINGAIPAYHMQLGDSYSDPDEAYLARIYAKLMSRFGGPNNTNKPLVTGPDVTITPLGITPVDMDYVATEDQLRTQTLAAFSVPKAIVCLTENMTYGSVKAEKNVFREYAVNAELTYTGQVITEKIIKTTPGCEDGICFWDDRVEEEPAQKLAMMQFRAANAAITPNQIQSECGDEPFPYGGDDPLLQGAPVPWVTGNVDQRMGDAWKQSVGAMKEPSGGQLTSTGGGEDIQDSALNGAQIASLVAITDAISEGRLPAEAARAIIEASFPDIPRQTIDRIIDSMKSGAMRDAVRSGEGGDADLDRAFRRALGGGGSGSSGGYLIKPEQHEKAHGHDSDIEDRLERIERAIETLAVNKAAALEVFMMPQQQQQPQQLAPQQITLKQEPTQVTVNIPAAPPAQVVVQKAAAPNVTVNPAAVNVTLPPMAPVIMPSKVEASVNVEATEVNVTNVVERVSGKIVRDSEGRPERIE